MNTQEIKEYEYQILMSVNNNFDTKLKEAEVEGWERIGDVLLSKGGAYNQDTIAQIPMRKPIGNKREKPVIEVGKWYKQKGAPRLCGLWLPIEIDGNKEKSFGFGNSQGSFVEKGYRFISSNPIEADMNEVTEALTKYFDKYYEGVEKVDRTGLDSIWVDTKIVKLTEEGNSFFDEEGFVYKSRYVTDKHGNIARPVKDEEPKITVKVIDNPVEKEEVKEMFVNVFNNGHKNYVGMNIHDSIDNCHESIGLSCDTKHLGIFKLVKVK